MLQQIGKLRNMQRDIAGQIEAGRETLRGAYSVLLDSVPEDEELQSIYIDFMGACKEELDV